MQKFNTIESILILGILCSLFLVSGVFGQNPDECFCMAKSWDSSYADPCLCPSNGQGDISPSLCSCPFTPSKAALSACCSCVFGPSCSQTVRFQAGNLNVNFTANVSSGPAPLAVQFSDGSSGNPNGWAWDFGDGGVSSEENPVYIYLNPGLYSVGLTLSRSYSIPGTSFSESSGVSKPGYIMVTGVPAVIQESNPLPVSVSGKEFTSRLIESRNDETGRILIKYKQTRSFGVSRSQ